MTSNSPGQEPVEVEQPFITHLVELRDRLMRAVIVTLVVIVALTPFANDIYHWMAGPLMAVLPPGSKMIATQVASPFFAPFKLTIVAAVFIAMPYILYQLWAFVAPGLYAHEKRFALPLLVASVALFYMGVAFAYFAVFPVIFGYFANTAPEGVTVMPDISAYLDFALTTCLAFGAVFEVPIATILMVLVGFTTVESLAEKRPYIILAAFIIAALLTPPDVVSQTMMAVPMWLLFEVGLVMARILVKLKRRREEAAGPESMDAMLDRYEAEQAAVEGRSGEEKSP